MFNRKVVRVSMGISSCLAAGVGLNIFKRNTKPDNNENDTQKTKSESKSRKVLLDGYDLKQVQVIIRHGARTPIHTMNNTEQVNYSNKMFMGDLPYTVYNYQTVNLDGGPRPVSTYDAHYSHAERLLKGGAKRGELTKLGQEQMYLIGRLLRKQYIEQAKLVDSEFNPAQVYVRSTNTKRTIGTARCIVAGMFRAEALSKLQGKQLVFEDDIGALIRSTNIGRTIATARCIVGGMFGYQNLNKLSEPVKIHVNDGREDVLLPRTGVCHVLRQINHYAMIHGGDLPGLRENRLLVEELLGYEPDGSPGKHKLNFIDVRDDIVARETHGYPYPDKLKPHRPMIEENASKVMYYAFCAHQGSEREVAMKLSTGPLIKLLIDTVEYAEELGTKMYIYSCHDSTLVGLLGTLDIFDFEWPPFGSHVIVEMYENKEKQKYVRVSYNGKDKVVRGCSSELAPFEDFKKHIGHYAVDREEYDEVCSSNILEIIAKDEQFQWVEIKLTGMVFGKEHNIHIKVTGGKSLFEVLQKETTPRKQTGKLYAIDVMAQEKGEVEDSEDKERSDTPAGM